MGRDIWGGWLGIDLMGREENLKKLLDVGSVGIMDRKLEKRFTDKRFN
jgi:hypothetical protein